ncbi:MAG: ABC transporter substrate-binding protein [Nitrospinota bacterium]
MRTRKPLLILVAVAAALALALPSRAAMPKRGGTVLWFNYADPTRLDVHTESALTHQQATAGIYSGLLQHDPEKPGEPVPDLATGYQASEDGTVFTFRLRQGVKWHDGKPFTAQDVVATFERVTKEDFRSPRCGTMVKPLLAKVEAVDDHTVKFTLKHPAGTFIPSIASAWCRIVPKHILERDKDLNQAKSIIGTGPFKLKDYKRGSIIEWERNPGYFIPGLPYVDGVRQFILVGTPTQLAAAKAGRLMLWDTWPTMSKSQAEEVKKAQGERVKIYSWPINTVFITYLNPKMKPFDNPEMRKAVRLALNPQEVIAKVFEGAGTPCSLLDPKLYGDYALPQEEVLKAPGCNPATKERDIEEARRIVLKHHPNGVEIEVATRTVADYVDRSQLIIQQLRKIGIRVNFKTYESAVGFRNWGAGNFTLIATQDTAMVMSDPHSMFALTYSGDGGRSYSRWKDPKIEELIDKGLRETDKAKRVKIYHDLQRYILSKPDHPNIVVSWIEGWFFEDTRLKNYRQATTVYDNNTFQKVWLDQ